MAGLLHRFFALCLLVVAVCSTTVAAANGPVTRYSDVRRSVAQAIPAKTVEMEENIEVLVQLSMSTVAAIANLVARCPAK